MSEKKESYFEDLVERIKDISLEVERLTPFGEIKEVKGFGKSGHIIMPNDSIGEKVLIIKFPKTKDK
jgi:putative transposon-encoded protein